MAVFAYFSLNAALSILLGISIVLLLANTTGASWFLALLLAVLAIGIIPASIYAEHKKKRENRNRKEDIARMQDQVQLLQEAAAHELMVAEELKFKAQAEQFLAEKARISAEDASYTAETAHVAKSEFLANISHEVRTPMNAILGLADILLASQLNEKQRQYITLLQTSAQTLMSLINELFTTGSMEPGSITLENAPFNMTQLLDQVISIMSDRAREKGLKLIVNYQPYFHKTFIGDSGRIRQILLNLVANAIQFTPKGSVSVSYTEQKKEAGKQEMTIAVTDTGIGVPEHKIDLIFDRFAQSDSPVTRNMNGSGIGLSICKALAERMGGAITVTSKPGAGSSFALHLKLPFEEEVSESEASTENILYLDTKKNARKRPILLVEDYEPSIFITTMIFDNFGYHYDVARNGGEALEKFSSGRYSIVLMDVEMPAMDGYEVTRRIRELEKSKGSSRVPIIAMTAHALKGAKEKCLAAGMDDYIAKPFTPHELQSMLLKYHKKGPHPFKASA